MIIIGYPGIGKSSICGKDNIVDLESSLFQYDGSEYGYQNWYRHYARVAIDLSRQGYTVCVSSHEFVINSLISFYNPYVDRICVIYPELSQEMKEKWIKRVEDRYYESRKNDGNMHWVIEKNFRAWQRVKECYDLDISILEDKVTGRKGFVRYVLFTTDYDLKNVIDSVLKE